MKKELEAFAGQKIVVDTSSALIYIGTLEKVTKSCLVLSNVDVHDGSDSSTSKDYYIFETRQTGIKSNRESVYINLAYVVSFSLLDDVKKF